MLTSNNGLALFVKEIQKKVKQAELFVEYVQCGYMNIVIIMNYVFFNDLV